MFTKLFDLGRGGEVKEKKTGNVRDRGLNKDVCGASREVVVDAGMRERGSGFKSGSQGLESKAGRR